MQAMDGLAMTQASPASRQKTKKGWTIQPFRSKPGLLLLAAPDHVAKAVIIAYSSINSAPGMPDERCCATSATLLLMRGMLIVLLLCLWGWTQGNPGLHRLRCHGVGSMFRMLLLRCAHRKTCCRCWMQDWMRHRMPYWPGHCRRTHSSSPCSRWHRR